MMQPCIFKALTHEDCEVDLGVLDSRGTPCVAVVSKLDGVFIHSTVRNNQTHIVEPGQAYVAIVKYGSWKHPAVLYFRSDTDRQRYIDNRVEALRVLVHAKYS